MKKQALYSVGLIVGAVALGCGGAGGAGPSIASFGSFTAELVGTAQPPVTTSSSYGANATAIAGAQFDKLSLTASGANTLADTKIAFSTTRDGGSYEIYSMNPDGTGLLRLTNNAAIDYDAKFSPAGTKIVFVSSRDGNDEIYSMGADGTSQTRLTNGSSTDYWPCWSPNGTRIAFTTNRDGNYEIYTMDNLGSTVSRKTNDAGVDQNPSWSPDGSKIAFSSNRDGNYEIYTMNYDGTHQTRLTNNTSTDLTPSWSPDGSKIAFSANRDGNYEVYTMNADGTGQTRVTTTATTGEDTPTYSPDGSKIVFSSFRDGNEEVYVMNVNGSNQTNLTKLPSIADHFTHWSGYLARKQQAILGSGGSLGTVGAGFIFAQKLEGITSILTFDTTPLTMAARAGARVVAQTSVDSTSSSLIFAITTTTALGSMKYAPLDGTGTPGTVTTIPIPVGMSAALVSFNSSTGLLSSVIPYMATRSPLSAPVRSGNELTYTGSFGTIVDAEGKTVAPSGATIVTINELTGKVVRHQR